MFSISDMPRCRLLKVETHYHAETVETLSMAKQCHAHHELLGVISGSYEVEVGGRHLRGRPGDCFYYPPGLPHTPRISTCGESVLRLLQWHENHDGEGRPRTWADATGRWLDATGWMCELADLPRPVGQPALDGLLRALLTGFTVDLAGGGHHRISPQITRLRIYLRTRLHERHSLRSLASVAHLSREGLLRRWKREVGLTPMADLRRMRLEAAQRLLRTTRCTQAKAALSCGFADAAHLNRMLKKG